MTTKTKFLEAGVRSHLLYSVQAWELYACELRKIESIWHNFLRKMVAHGFKRKNVPLEYLKQKHSKPKHATDILEPVDLDWAFVFPTMILKILPKHLVFPISVNPNTLNTLLTLQDSIMTPYKKK